MADMIITSECEECIHSAINDLDKARVKVYCSVKDKAYFWGQCIPCDHKEKRKDSDFLPYINAYSNKTYKLSDTEQGDGGFGSTGK